MKTIHAHINQIADGENTLRFDEIEVKGQISENGEYYVTVSADEIFTEDGENFTETTVNVASVIHDWMRPMNVAHDIDGMIAVQCADGK